VIVSSSQQPFSPAAARALVRSRRLASVTVVRVGEFKDAHRSTQAVSGIDPLRLESVYDPGVTSGSLRALARPDTIAVQEGYARRNSLRVGSSLPALFAKRGTTPLRVAAIFRDDTFGIFFLSLSDYRRDFTAQEDDVLLATARPGVSADAAAVAASNALASFPNLKVRTKAEYKAFVVRQITTFLRLFYALLAMAVVIAVFGIVLTLALSVFERTREIGLLRAVGLSRRAVRAMIRWEAIIVALIGALVGLVLGVFLGTVSVSAIPQFKAVAIPWGSMVVFFAAAGVFGVLAALLPARRAARLDILAAIQSE